MALAFSKFKVKETGVEFLYCNKNNRLYDTEFNRLPLGNKSFRGDIKGINMTTKSDKPLILRISMGQKCNFKCSYCMQEDLAGMKEILDPNIHRFMKQLQQLDLSELERVELWGGEAFAYWPTMKVLMDSFLDREGLEWYVPTNGSLIKLHHIAFFDSLKGTVLFGISHDGPKQEEVRGRCPLKKLVPVLQEIDKRTDKYGYSFNVTFSLHNHNINEVWDYFLDYANDNGLENMAMNWSPVESYDFMSFNQTIHGDELVEFRKELKTFLDRNLEAFKIKKDAMILRSDMFYNADNGVIKFIESLKKTNQAAYGSRCAADWDRLISVDINGDVITCPHVSSDTHKCGTIDKIDEAKIQKVNYMRPHNGNGDGCINCPVLLLCNKGCPLDLPDIFRERSCDVLKAFHSEVQLAGFRLLFNSDIEYVGKIPLEDIPEINYDEEYEEECHLLHAH